MSNLGCSVRSCGNNASGLCCLSSIDVSGGSATSSSETSCRSYRPASGAANSVNEASASPVTNITCKACNCKHNDNCKCNAGSVTIDNCGCGNGAGCQTFKE
ncbi:hypothetical protein OBV_13310 [Oscillibacter valericigenes Sjm18-20]|nr:hypothetical protein OBV_13310 [Oscillibacter valericigenes Sjm18-20]